MAANSAVGTINVYARTRKLNNVVANVRYVSTEAKQQEKLVAVVGEKPAEFWERLAADNQYFSKNLKEGNTAREGREFILALTPDAGGLSLENKIRLLESVKELIDSQTGTDCLVAWHNSHPGSEVEKNNDHLHIVIPERALLPEPEQIVAERNLFYNADGKRVYKKSEIMENGELKAGCSIVPKGTVLHTRYFGSKDDAFTKKWWMQETKQELADWINEQLQPDLKRVLADENSLFVPQYHLAVNWQPKTAEDQAKKDSMIEANKAIKEYNQAVRDGKFTQKAAEYNKTLIMTSPDRKQAIDNIKANNFEYVPREKKNPEVDEFRRLHRNAAMAWKAYREYKGDDREYKAMLLRRGRAASAAIDEQQRIMGLWKAEKYADEIEKKRNQAEWLRKYIQNLHERLQWMNNQIYSIDGRIRFLKDQLFNAFWGMETYGNMSYGEIKAQLEEARAERRELIELQREQRDELITRKVRARREQKAVRKQMKELKRERRTAVRSEGVQKPEKAVSTAIPDFAGKIANRAGGTAIKAVKTVADDQRGRGSSQNERDRFS